MTTVRFPLSVNKCCQVTCVMDIGTVFMEIPPFVLLQDTRQPEKHKSLAFPLCLWHLQRDRQTGRLCNSSEAPSKTAFRLNCQSGARCHVKPHFAFSCLISAISPPLPCFLASSSWRVVEQQQQPWCTWVSHHRMNFRMKTQRCHQLMWVIHFQWEFHPGEETDISSLI